MIPKSQGYELLTKHSQKKNPAALKAVIVAILYVKNKSKNIISTLADYV